MDGYTFDVLLGEHVGEEVDLHTLGYHLHTLDLCQIAGDGERVAEVGIVERLGIDHVDAVELLI